MKGMLTGPVTILCWSFVRDDARLARDDGVAQEYGFGGEGRAIAIAMTDI
jgi:hypothetical protein